MPKILIADDNIVVRDACSKLAKQVGYATMTAESGKEAFEKSPNADVVLMDCFMYGMTGLEALAEIRAQDATKPVIMMSGLLDDERIKTIERLNAKYIRKPFRIDCFLEMLREYNK